MSRVLQQDNAQRGFSLIELLVALGIFSLAGTAMYQVLFASTAGSKRAQAVVTVSEEARLGFNRMVRDAREAQDVWGNETDTTPPSATRFTVSTDFNANGVIEPTPAGLPGSYERVTYTFNEAADRNGTITITAAGQTETLMAGVDCIRKGDGSCHRVFTYASSRLEYDTNGDGVTSEIELDQSPVGDANGVLNGSELEFVDRISFALRVTSGPTSTNFYAEAQTRNQR